MSAPRASPPPPLVASYRLQLRDGVGFRDARALVPQLARLGVSHLYLSPIFRARTGSAHGYDAVDPCEIDPALGGGRELARLSAALHARGLGLLLDVVPNHLAADPESPAFADLLRHGPASRYAAWFDVDWGPPHSARHAPLLLPVLGDPLAHALARGELTLERVGSEPAVRYHERHFPLDPATLPAVLLPAARALEHAGADREAGRLARAAFALRALPRRRSPDPARAGERAAGAARAGAELADLCARSRAARRALDASCAQVRGPALGRLLARQPYRLAFWRRARHVLNYRRFFDVNELIALRPEDPAVFDATHRTLLDLVARRLVDGLRIDHVDGLADPQGYLVRLRREVDARLPASSRAAFPIFVEKILARGERLPRAWPVEGTTGYEHLNALEAALLDPQGARAVEECWSRATGMRTSFEEAARDGKRRVLDDLLDADVRRLARDVAHRDDCAVCRDDCAVRRDDWAVHRDVAVAIREVIAHLPVYRTYARPDGTLRAGDRRRLERALGDARDAGRATPGALERVARALLPARGERARADLVGRFQQLSGPAAAKGVEDTALYVHVPLVSRNEVGGEPGAPLERAVPELHATCRERARDWPRMLLAATTHDTKRSADVRARLDVLSEVPGAWSRAVARWRRFNRPLRARVRGRLAPDANTEYLLYQTLFGVWPLPAPGRDAGALPSARALAALRERVQAYMEKAAREAKRRTSWINPDPAFEEALRAFTGALLDPRAARDGAPFLPDLARFAAGLMRPGLWNALARQLVQLAAPGVPDVYRGDELFYLALVDPDNRRPVDFEIRHQITSELAARLDWRGSARASADARAAYLGGLVARPEDGRLKLHVIRAGLDARRRRPAVFARGDHTPLRASGAAAGHVLAFARRAGRHAAIAVVPRLPHALASDGRAPVGAAIWGAAALRLPDALAGRALHSVLDGARHRIPSGRAPSLRIADLLAHLPVALLVTR